MSTLNDPIRSLLNLAMEGDAEAQYLMATEYVTGDRVESSEERALFWYLKSAGGGYTAAKWNAGMMIIDDANSRSSADIEFALKLIESAAAASEPSANEFISHCYSRGKHGFPIDHVKSTSYLKCAKGGRAFKTLSEPIDVPDNLVDFRLQKEYSFDT